MLSLELELKLRSLFYQACVIRNIDSITFHCQLCHDSIRTSISLSLTFHVGRIAFNSLSLSPMRIFRLDSNFSIRWNKRIRMKRDHSRFLGQYDEAPSVLLFDPNPTRNPPLDFQNEWDLYIRRPERKSARTVQPVNAWRDSYELLL